MGSAFALGSAAAGCRAGAPALPRATAEGSAHGGASLGCAALSQDWLQPETWPSQRRAWSAAGLVAGATAARSSQRRRSRAVRRSRGGQQDRKTPYGPQRSEPQPPRDSSYELEFQREFERDRDPRRQQAVDSLKQCCEWGDWGGASKALDDVWKANHVPDLWMYQKVIQCCLDDKGDEECRKAAKELAETLQKEVDSWCRKPHLERFQMTPRVSWERQLMMAGCHAHNVLDWKRDHDPPWCHSPTRVWLLPSQDEQAEMIAEHETQLWQNGWKVIGNKPEVLATLRDKSELHRLAERVGQTSAMPAQYKTPAEAQFPCIVKPARGTWGKDTIVAYSSEEIVRTARRNKLHEVERLTEQRIEYEQQCWKMSHPNDEIDDEWNESMREQVDDAVNEYMEEAAHEELGDGWVLQELIEGKYEYSTTLLVKDGEILDYACTRYTFASDTYVWPALDYNIWDYVSVPAKHLAVFVDFLAGFSGISNFNYKIRKKGDIGIFEVNPRVGGDLAFDMPKKRVRAMLEKLDAMF